MTNTWRETVGKASANDMIRMLRLMGGPISILEDYIIPGLQSAMYCKTADGGMLREFRMGRHQEMEIVPHDHRYNFQCVVLEGGVTHRIYDLETVSTGLHAATHVIVPYSRETKGIDLRDPNPVRLTTLDETYHKQGEWYGLKHDQFHSVRFAKGSRVLFIEGGPQKDTSHCLLPVEHGRILNTYFWAPWMMREVAPEGYKRETA